MKRKLAAIMFTDIVGYTKLMGSDEDRAFQVLDQNVNLQRTLIEKYKGKFLKQIGDGILASFSSTYNAVLCAKDIIKTTMTETEFQIRIGIHEGDIVFKENDVYGDGVNIASRLQEEADDGCICISEVIYKNIKNKTDINAEFLEEKNLKNVDHPIKIYTISNVDLKSTIPVDSNAEKSEPPQKSIIVLPFENISPDPDQEYFSDGLTEEIITDLSHIHDLLVISRNSSKTFKGTKKKTTEIAKEVNVRYVLEGSVRKAGNNLRIVAQLIDALTDTHIWAEKYSGTLDDIFDIQEKVSRSIVDSLKLKLSPKEDKKISEHSIDNLQAYEAYLRATSAGIRGTEEAMYDAIRYFQNAIDIMGDNVILYSGMAYTYFLLMNIGINVDENRAKVEEYAKKALAIDPGNIKVRAILVILKIWYTKEKNLKEVVRQSKEILAVNPNETLALLGMIIAYVYAGKISVAFPLSDRYRQIEPFDIWSIWFSGALPYYNGQFELALQEHYKYYKTDPKQPGLQVGYAVYLIYNNQIEEALTIIDHSARATPDHVHTKMGLMFKYGLIGNKQAALQELKGNFYEWCRREAAWSYWIAVVFALLNSIEETIDWLENAVNLGFIHFPYFAKIDPLLENIRSDSRFKKLMVRVKQEWENFEI
jgi:adenylate cyclase